MIIVKSKANEQEYVLLGPAYGMYRSQGATGLLGALSSNEGEKRLLALADEHGEIHWAEAKDFTVYKVDGLIISEVLKEDK